MTAPVLTKRNSITFDETNPRKADDARLSLLRLSIAKLGFLMPLFCDASGMLLSGHQRTTVTDSLGIDVLPLEVIDIEGDKVRGINILFNRATNDFGAMDNGSSAELNINIQDLIADLGELPTLTPTQWPVMNCKDKNIKRLAKSVGDDYDKKAVIVANSLLRQNIRIPIVVTESGRLINGRARVFSALENEEHTWPTVTIGDSFAELAEKLLNYLSMDFDVDEDMANILRSSAFRRPQNARGNVPKAMRYWASNNRTLSDKDTYTDDFWCLFRQFHGHRVLDFGSGLSRAAPFLRKKGIDAIDFEPYMIDMAKNKSQPDLTLSRSRARNFLTLVGEGVPLDSIFLCSVMNSVPFAEDRLKVLCIVHALCGFGTKVYGTCRDISDYNYEYAGVRQANYFVFDTEDGVRIGDVMANPKIQKFHTINEADDMLSRFWTGREFHKGGNVFYFSAACPKRLNPTALVESLRFEFDLPYKDGTMGLAEYAIDMFSQRLGVDLRKQVARAAKRKAKTTK